MVSEEEEYRLTKRLLWLTREVEHLNNVEHRTRMRLLCVHAAKLILVGILILLFGATPAIERTFGLWIRPFVGCLSIFGGITLIIGVIFGNPRHPWREMLGLTWAGLWDLTMLTTFIISIFNAPCGAQFVSLGEPVPSCAATVYPAAVYAALMTMVWFIHIPALMTYAKVERTERQ